ncbi:MAG: urease accessory protein UreF [Hyphomicrobiales bacterium]
MAIITGIRMTDLKSMIRLQTWLSPAFPIGAFSYSGGLEAAIDEGYVDDAKSLTTWLTDILENGTVWNDAVLLAEAWRSATDKEALSELVDLAQAMSFSSERYLETMDQGSAFLLASKAWQENDLLPAKCPLPIAIGVLAARMDVALEDTVAASLHAVLSNQIQAALRLMKLGQQGALDVLASLEGNILQAAAKAANSTLDDLGSCAIIADIAAMKHETMQSRIFRS